MDNQLAETAPLNLPFGDASKAEGISVTAISGIHSGTGIHFEIRFANIRPSAVYASLRMQTFTMRAEPCLHVYSQRRRFGFPDDAAVWANSLSVST